MHPEPPHTRKPFEKPEITTFEGRKVGRDLVKQTREIKTPNRTFYLRRHVTQKELDILKILRAHGVSVEIPFSNKPLGKTEVMAYFGAGIPLAKKISKLSREQKKDVVFQLVSNISKMHTLGVTHGHLHADNIVINPENKITIIDLKFAEHAKEVPWNDFNKVFAIFHADYFSLVKETLKPLGLNRDQIRIVLSGIIDRYPMEKYQKSILKQIVWDTSDTYI